MSTDTKRNGMADGEQRFPLDDAGEVTLPIVEVLTGRGFITGKSGSGKSNSASVIIEELLDRGFPVLIVDTDGEYWGLKEQYEILHVGADEECDLQVGPEHAGKLADLALEESVPIILDVSGYLDEEDASALVRETASALFAKEKKLNKPFLMLVEEIHEYLPEGPGSDETARMLTRVAKRGRKRGLGLCGMSQRPADVKKDFISQCDWLMWHRLTWENDTRVVGRVIGNDYKDPVQELADGEAFLMADFIDADIEKVQVRRKRTFDAGATPDLGDYERPELKSVSGDLVDELEEISEKEERRQDRIAELEARVEELQDDKQALEEELDDAQDMRDLAQQMAEGLQQTGDSAGVAEEKVDELVSERNELQTNLESRDERIAELEDEVADLQKELEQRPDVSERAVEAVDVLAEEFGAGGEDAQKLREKLKNARERIEELEDSRTAEPPDVLDHPSVERFISRIQNELTDLDEYESEMLQYYKFNGPAPVEDAYWAAGGSRKSSAKRKKNKTLLDHDLISDADERGEYRYNVPDRVREWFDGNDHVDESDVQAIVNEIETELGVKASA